MIRRTGIKIEFLKDGRAVTLARFGEVAECFVFDGASVPRFFWRLLGHPFDKRHLRGSLRHDWHYQNGDVSRRDADRNYYNDLVADGMPRVFAWLEWLAVRLCGWRHYNNKQRKNK